MREPSRRDLVTRSLKELRTLAWFMVVSYSGTKAALIDRIMKVWSLKVLLRNFNEPGELVKAFKDKELKEMCRTAGKWLGANKRAKAVTLLNWKMECRRK